MRILVTGSSGFIGSHIVDHYASLGHTVCGIDKVSPTYRHADVAYITADLLRLEQWQLEEILGDIDIINHHAAQTDVRYSIANPLLDLETNLVLTTKLLEAAANTDIKHFIFASSAGAIGAGEPKSPYGLSKLCAEKYIEHFNKHFTTSILRYSNVYGPRQRGGIIKILIDALGTEKVVKIFGGDQTRDFVHVQDIVKANEIALLTSGNFTISTGKSISVRSLIEGIEQLVGLPLSLQYLPEIREEEKFSEVSPNGPLDWQTSINLLAGLATILPGNHIDLKL